MPSLRILTQSFYTLIAFLVLGIGWGFAQENATDDQVATIADSTATTNKGIDSSFLFSGEEPKTIEELRFMEKHFAELAEKAFPATVNIQMGAAQGTGVVVSSDGYIMTAAHVIAGGAKKARITFMNADGTVQKPVLATPLGNGKEIDSGMLKIDEGQGDDFPYLDVGMSKELKLGQWVMAVGHPGGLDEKRGLVVRVGRIVFNSDKFIRTDCTLVGGDSGGPLVDMNGEVVGIHSRIGTKLLDNLHVPADTYSENWDDLANGVILDGIPSLAFNVVDRTTEVESVVEDGPADKAGLKAKDVVLKLGSISVADKSAIGKAVKQLNLRPNKTVKIVVEREGEEKVIRLKVGEKKRSR